MLHEAEHDLDLAPGLVERSVDVARFDAVGMRRNDGGNVLLKSGTVTFDVSKAVSDVKAGKVEYRTDRAGNIHLGIGRRSFEERQLIENYQAVIEEIVRVKPASAKGRYIKSITFAQTMGPGVPVDTTQTTSSDVLEEPAA
jgi:large subunit ribosomal protein L1